MRVSFNLGVISCAAYPHYPPCSVSRFYSALVVLEVMIEDHKGTMPSLGISSLTRRALNLSVVTLLTGICFPLSGMGIYTKFGPGPFRCFHNYSSQARTSFDVSCRPMSWAHFRNHPLGLFPVKYCIRFRCFPPHLRLPQIFVGRTSGSSPS